MIYDCFTFFNELDLLEIRLNILDKYVDKFVICESDHTFSGIPKPYYFLENQERFSKWKDKIEHVKFEVKDFVDSFEMAFNQKEALKGYLENHANDEDIIYYGDLDEIWKPQKVEDDDVYNLEQINYCYYLNQRSSERWVGTIVGKWKTIKNNTLRHWRATHTCEILDAGWHFTNMGGIDQIKKKLAAYDHQEFNRPEVLENLEQAFIEGKDYVGRQNDWEGFPFNMWIDESDLPQYLLDNKDKWKKLFL